MLFENIFLPEQWQFAGSHQAGRNAIFSKNAARHWTALPGIVDE